MSCGCSCGYLFQGNNFPSTWLSFCFVPGPFLNKAQEYYWKQTITRCLEKQFENQLAGPPSTPMDDIESDSHFLRSPTGMFGASFKMVQKRVVSSTVSWAWFFYQKICQVFMKAGVNIGRAETSKNWGCLKQGYHILASGW